MNERTKILITSFAILIMAGTAILGFAAIKANGQPLTIGGLIKQTGIVLGEQFEASNTPPYYDGVDDGQTYSEPVAITFGDYESEATATLDGVEIISGTMIATNGSHTLTVTDAEGEMVTCNFTIQLPDIAIDPLAVNDFSDTDELTVTETDDEDITVSESDGSNNEITVSTSTDDQSIDTSSETDDEESGNEEGNGTENPVTEQNESNNNSSTATTEDTELSEVFSCDSVKISNGQILKSESTGKVYVIIKGAKKTITSRLRYAETYSTTVSQEFLDCIPNL